MAINYPGSPPGSATDAFPVPSNPAGTPLSEAGTGTRNLTQSIGDEGLAIAALQSWATLRTHDHSGDGSSVATGAKLAQANTHQNADTDTATTSIHHTLDPSLTSALKAAPAYHQHDYNGPMIVNKPLVACTSTTRPTNPTTGMLIYETDTNVMRVYAQFSPSDVAHTGLYATDSFSTTYSSGMGPNWNINYYPNANLPAGFNSTSGGVMGVPDGANLQWVYSYVGFSWPFLGWPWPYVQGRGIAQRVNSTDRYTQTDNQVLTWQAGPVVMGFNGLWPPTPSANDFYLRCNDAMTSWVRVSYTYQPAVGFSLWLILFTITITLAQSQEIIQVYYTTNGVAGETLLGTLTIPAFNPFANYQIIAQGNTFNLYVDANFVGKVVDSGNVAAIGSSNRGWGVGMTVGRSPSWANTEFHHPTLVNQIWMNDVSYYTGSPLWQLLPVASRPICRYEQHTQQAVSGAGTIITWDTVAEDTFNFLNPAVSTSNIVVSEPGVYDTACTVQVQATSGAALFELVLYLNGQPTSIRTNVWLQQGFNQAVAFSGKMRFAENDLVQVQAFYTGQTYSNPAAAFVSNFQLSFDSP